VIDFIIDFGATALAFIVLLTVLVFVHEMGHYLVARWCGVRVEVFSIGFGRELFGWNDRKQTRWKIAMLPFGGYVKFFGDMNAASAPDGRLNDSLTEAERRVAFHHKGLLQRVAIVFAGPLANIVYAIVVLALVYALYGQRITPPEVGRVLEGSTVEAAGFQRGDVVREIDGRSIARFEEIVEAILLNPGRELEFLVRRGDRELALKATPTPRETSELDGIERVIGELPLLPTSRAVAGKIIPGSAADEAGLKEGDRIVAIGDQPVDSFEDLQDIVGASGGRELTVRIERNGEELERPITPRLQSPPAGAQAAEPRWLLGIQSGPRPLVRHGPLDALGAAVGTSVDMVRQTGEYLGEMIVGERGTEDLGGPLRIAHASGQAAKVGIEQLIMLSVLLSLNLGLINLLPIPVLDGGHLLLYACEAARGRPLTERMQEYAFRFGLAMILTLAVFVTWNDLVQLKVFDFLVGIF
jgi:regulator of sigma E protease